MMPERKKIGAGSGALGAWLDGKGAWRVASKAGSMRVGRLARSDRLDGMGAWRVAISEEKAKIAKTGAFLAESHPFVSEEKAKIAKTGLFLAESHPFAKNTI